LGQRHSAANRSVTILNSTLFCLDIWVHFNADSPIELEPVQFIPEPITDQLFHDAPP